MSRVRPEILGLGRDTLYIAIWQGSIAVADFVQIALVARGLGLSNYGQLAVVISGVTLVAQLFDLRTGWATTVYSTRYLTRGDGRRALGVIQFGFVLQAASTALAVTCVLGVASLLGDRLGVREGALLAAVYCGVFPLGVISDTGFTTLRVLDRFANIAWTGVAVEIVRVVLLAFCVLSFGSLMSVVIALVVYEAVKAIAAGAVAAHAVGRELHYSILDTDAIGSVSSKWAIARASAHTNVLSYARLIQNQAPPLVMAAIGTTAQVGLYKVAAAVATMIAKMVEPASSAILPRIARLVEFNNYRRLDGLVRQATIGAGGVLVLSYGVVLLFRTDILKALGGDAAVLAGSAVAIMGIAQVLNGTVFWNYPLLMAGHRSGLVALSTAAGALLQIALLPILFLELGVTGAAIAYCSGVVAANTLATAWAVRLLGARRSGSVRSGVSRHNDLQPPLISSEESV